MTVKELIEKLKEYPEELEVLTSDYLQIEKIEQKIWEDTNYPYNKPDKEVVIIY